MDKLLIHVHGMLQVRTMGEAIVTFKYLKAKGLSD